MSLALVLALAGVAVERRAVVLTTDCGASFDDQWAIVHMARSPAIELRGVIGALAPNLGKDSSEVTAREAGEWLDRSGMKPRPPVFAGSPQPLDDRNKPRPNPGVTFLIEQSQRHSARDRLTVVMLGPATDVASALLIDPTLADRIRIVAMAFNGWPGGGDVWNVKNDVKAWQVVLESRAPIVVGDAFTTQRDLALTTGEAKRLFGDTAEPGPGLVRLLGDWVGKKPELARETTGRADAGPVWDQMATASLLGLVRTETRPRPRLRDDLSFDHARPNRTIEWVTSVNARALWADLRRLLNPAGDAQRVP